MQKFSVLTKEQQDHKMFFALLILMILATLLSIWYGRPAYAAWFMLATIGIAIVLALDIDTPLNLTF
jgi:hypothetical protein